MGSENDDPNKALHTHAIVFPYPFQGHITPTLHFALALASRPQFSVTFVLTHFLRHAISKSFDSCDGDGDDDVDFFAGCGLDIRCVTISDGFPLDFDRSGFNNDFRESLVRDFPARADKLVGRIIESSSSSAVAERFFLVADSLYTWPASVAEKHGVVNVSFWTEPATVFSVNYHLDLLTENGHFPDYTDDGESPINYIPGIRSIKTKDLMSYIRHPNAIPGVINMVIKAFDQVKNADFIVCNTVQELEPEALLVLNQKQSTYAIGPINLFNNVNKTIVEKMSLWPKLDCSEWLNSKPHCSVLYISFGSIVRITKNVIWEIAQGLLLNQVNFLWVLRTNDDNVLPDGFSDNVKDRGLIVPWCNQGVVLSNRAIGGFLTHCGWNSILESIWNGVPMICHPLLVDQPTNRMLVVDDWKIGINLSDQGSINREEFFSKVDLIMTGEPGIKLREEVNKLREIFRNVLETNGSSHRNLNQFVDDLMGRFQCKKEYNGDMQFI